MESSVITMRNILNMNKIKEIKKKCLEEKLEDYSSKMLESPCQYGKYEVLNLISAYHSFLVVYNEQENENIETNYELKIYIPKSIILLAKVSLELKFSTREIDNNIIKRVYLGTVDQIILDAKSDNINFKNIFPSISHNNPIFYTGISSALFIKIIFSQDLGHYYNHVSINLHIDHIKLTDVLLEKFFLQYKKIKINETITMENGELKSKDSDKANFLITSNEAKLEALFNNNSKWKRIRFITDHGRNFGYMDMEKYRIKLYNLHDEEEYFDTYFTNMYCCEALNKENFIKHQKEIIVSFDLIPCQGHSRTIVYELKKNMRKPLYVIILPIIY